MLIPAVVCCSVATVSAQSPDPENCLLCHQFRGLSRYDRELDRLHVFFVDPDYSHSLAGPHGRLACTDCHVGDGVGVVPHGPVARVDCTRACHLADPGGRVQRFTHAGIADALLGSVHRPEDLTALTFSSGALLEQDQSACLYCHDEPVFRDAGKTIPQLALLGDEALHRCRACHEQPLDVNIAYALRHVSARLQPARPTLEVAQVCSVCHSDAKVLETLGLTDTVASYMRTFHGKAALLGDESTASCLSCHATRGGSVHAIVPHTAPQSPAHESRIAATCGTVECHPGAAPSIGDMGVHLDLPTSHGSLEYLLAAAFIILTVMTFGPSAVLSLLELLQLAVGRESPRDEHVRDLAVQLMDGSKGRKRLVRFSVSQRIQHWTLALLFVLLVLTGFPMKFAAEPWAAWLISGFGGLGVARLIHHVCGILLVVGFLGHMGYTLALVWVRSRSASSGVTPRGFLRTFVALPMWMTIDDARKTLHLLQYLCFLRSDRPKFGRFALKEKFEYIGVFWGTMILGVTGVLLWGEQLASHVLSGRILNLAGIAHTYEAFLALIHVGILHTYNVMLSPHVFPLSPATLTGTTPIGELVEGHAEFVEEAARDLGLSTPHAGGGS